MGMRMVKLEMSKPVSNFIHVQGHWVMADYCGMREIQPVRPRGPFYPRVQDSESVVPWYDRFGVFSHATAGCTVPYLQYGYGNGTRACTQQKSDAAMQRRDDRPRWAAAHTRP